MADKIQIPVTNASAKVVTVPDHFKLADNLQLALNQLGDGLFPFTGVLTVNNVVRLARELNGEVIPGTNLNVKVRDLVALVDGVVLGDKNKSQFDPSETTTVNVASAVGTFKYLLAAAPRIVGSDGLNRPDFAVAVYELANSPALPDTGKITLAKVTLPGGCTQVLAQHIDTSVRKYIMGVDELKAWTLQQIANSGGGGGGGYDRAMRSMFAKSLWAVQSITAATPLFQNMGGSIIDSFEITYGNPIDPNADTIDNVLSQNVSIDSINIISGDVRGYEVSKSSANMVALFNLEGTNTFWNESSGHSSSYLSMNTGYQPFPEDPSVTGKSLTGFIRMIGAPEYPYPSSGNIVWEASAGITSSYSFCFWYRPQLNMSNANQAVPQPLFEMPNPLNGADATVMYGLNGKYYVVDQAGSSPVEVGNIVDNVWVHIGMTYDGTNIKVYMNGALVSTILSSPRDYTPQNVILMQSDWVYGMGGFGQGLAGDWDEILLQKNVLSLQEIAAIYASNTKIVPTYLSPSGTLVTKAFDVDTSPSKLYITCMLAGEVTLYGSRDDGTTWVAAGEDGMITFDQEPAGTKVRAKMLIPAGSRVRSYAIFWE